MEANTPGPDYRLMGRLATAFQQPPFKGQSRQ